MADFNGLTAEEAAVIEHLEQCRHLAQEIGGLNTESFCKGLESLARQIHNAATIRQRV